MIIKTEDFKLAASTILFAADLDKTAANLELEVIDNELCLSVTNREYYVRQKFTIETAEPFHAVVDAALFLNLIAGLSSQEFKLTVDDRAVIIAADKSRYKVPLIYENDALMALPTITLTNKTVEMPISRDILQSILTVNSKELMKVKNVDVNELQKLYYLTDEGCFTFTTGACLNTFKLDKPVKILLNDRIVKLFKLFKEDVQFSLGFDSLRDGTIQTKVIFETPTTYLAALIVVNDLLLSRVEGPCTATKNFINEAYLNKAVLSVPQLQAAIARIIAFTKHSKTAANMLYVPVKVIIKSDEFTLTDKAGNAETIAVENGSWVDAEYHLGVNVVDLKLVLDSCKDQHITFNCGNHRSVVITHGAVHNLIPELKEA